MNVKRKILAAILSGAMLLSGCGSDQSSEQSTGEKSFAYGTIAYGSAMENVGTDPHESYSGWSTLRYGIGETLFKFNEAMQLEPWLASDFEQVDEIDAGVDDLAVKTEDGVSVEICAEGCGVDFGFDSVEVGAVGGCADIFHVDRFAIELGVNVGVGDLNESVEVAAAGRFWVNVVEVPGIIFALDEI